MEEKAKKIKARLKEIQKEQNRIEAQIEKMDEDGLYDDGLYSSLSKLEEERDQLNDELDSLAS